MTFIDQRRTHIITFLVATFFLFSISAYSALSLGPGLRDLNESDNLKSRIFAECWGNDCAQIIYVLETTRSYTDDVINPSYNYADLVISREVLTPPIAIEEISKSQFSEIVKDIPNHPNFLFVSRANINMFCKGCDWINNFSVITLIVPAFIVDLAILPANLIYRLKNLQISPQMALNYIARITTPEGARVGHNTFLKIAEILRTFKTGQDIQ